LEEATELLGKELRDDVGYGYVSLGSSHLVCCSTAP